MKVYYACDELPSMEHHYGIFLAGPTPRDDDVTSWRPEALEILEELDYDGAVFVPERKDGGWHGNYDEQVFWEWEALGVASCVLFWVPRTLDEMPGFTTNVEFGFMMALYPKRVILGAPEGAMKMNYLRTLALHQARFAGLLKHYQPRSGRNCIVQARDLRSALCYSIERERLRGG